MNNQRSSTQQFFVFLALSWCAMYVFSSYFGPKKPAGAMRPMPKNALQTAFAGLDPAKPVLTEAAAKTELTKLEADIQKNDADDHSYWARLRAGLIQQYILKDAKAALKRYDEIAGHQGLMEVGAQGAWQKGDLLWQQGLAKDGKPSYDAAWALQTMVHRGRSSSEYLDLKIYVPATEVGTVAPAKIDPLSLPAAWAQETVRTLHGTADKPYPNGILDRIDAYYATTTFHKVFDWAVKLFGNNPALSYGFAILAFAVITRMLLQPLNKKQYDSMRGMAIIGPEMKKIQDKYKNKKDQESQMKMMNEIRALQKSHGVNPMLGCGLAAVQIPVFFYIVSPFIQHFEARMEMVGASFLWIDNLARPDIPLLVLYALSQFASMRLASTPPADDQQRQMQMMMLFFPFVVPFFLLAWPSAFTMYWMAFNILSMFFQFGMMKKADPTKRLWDQLVKQPLIPKIVIPDSPPGTVAGAVPPRPKGSTSKVREEAVKTLAPGSGSEGQGKGGSSYVSKSGVSKSGGKNGSGSNGNGTGPSLNGSLNGSTNGVSSVNGSTGNGSTGNGSTGNGATANGNAIGGSSGNGSTTARKKRKKR